MKRVMISIPVAIALMAANDAHLLAQTLISCDLSDIDDSHMIYQSELSPNLVYFTAYLDGDPVWAGPSEAASGSLYWVYVDEPFDEWDVFIDPAPGWLDFPLEPNPSDLRGSGTAYFRWWIEDSRP